MTIAKRGFYVGKNKNQWKFKDEMWQKSEENKIEENRLKFEKTLLMSSCESL
jgi:hypothetical protein